MSTFWFWDGVLCKLLSLSLDIDCVGLSLMSLGVIFSYVASTIGLSVEYVDKNFSGGNTFLSNGHIPVALNPEIILAGVIALGKAYETILGMT